LHLLLKARQFLAFYFGSAPFEDIGVFYSHFEIVKHSKNLIINIFFYHGVLEGLVDDFFFDTWYYFVIGRELGRKFLKYKYKR